MEDSEYKGVQGRRPDNRYRTERPRIVSSIMVASGIKSARFYRGTSGTNATAPTERTRNAPERVLSTTFND
jgi:hypothetical protein